MKIYFASWLIDRSLSDSLNTKKARTQLLSYHYLTDLLERDKNIIKTFVKTALYDPRKKKTKKDKKSKKSK